MSITKEENSSLLIAESANQNIPDEDLTLTGQLTRKLSFRRGSFNIGNNKSTATTTSETKPMIKKESNTNSVKTHSTKHKHNEIRINIEDMSTESTTTANCTSTNQNQNLSPNQDLKEIDEVVEVQTQSSQEKE